MIAKYLATSLAMLKVVSAPRVISSCLPISTISMSFVGLESRSTMLPASLAACVPVFMATPTSAWASAGASLVPSPVIATSWPARLLLADAGELVLRGRLGEEVVDAGLGGDRGGGQRVVAGDHDGADAHRAQLGEALLDAALDDVLQEDDAEELAAVGDDERRAAARARSRRPASTSGRDSLAAERLDPRAFTLAAAPLRMLRAVAAGRRGRRRSSASAR
jgi:hypothetical protein